MSAGSPITFLSDYGYRDEFAGVCRAVIAGIAPGVHVTDLTHGIGPGDVRGGALALASALPFCPPGVHLAVVDPGVGSERRAVAVSTRGSPARVLVGPDNGLLVPALERLGGTAEAVEISRSPFRLEPMSVTFHGRDVFAPVAAHFSLGAAMADVGEALDPDTLERLELPVARVEGDHILAHALRIDGYGNVALDLPPVLAQQPPLGPEGRVRVIAGGAEALASRGRTFADAPEGHMLLYLDSAGALALAVNAGSAAGALGLSPGDEVELRPA